MEKLFLLEVLVENVEIDYTKVDVDKKVLDAAKQLCIKIQFLSFPELTICEEDFCPSTNGDYQKSSINIKSGKSCLFSIRHWNAEDRSMPLSVTVLRTNPAPPHITVGRACINLGSSFTNILAAAQSTEYTETITKKCTDVYVLTNNSGTDIGKIRMFVRLTCFGPLIVTQFQISGDENNSFLFRGNDGSGIVTFNRNNSDELSDKPAKPVHIPTKQVPCGELQQPKYQQDQNRPADCPPCPPCPPCPQEWNITGGIPGQGMMTGGGQGMMPQSGQRMMPGMGQGMPQNAQGMMMPGMGQGMPQNAQGMMPQNAQGMMPQNAQGMMPGMGQGMPQNGQGMITGVVQGMPQGGQGMMPWGEQMMPSGGQMAMPAMGSGMMSWEEAVMLQGSGGPVTIMTAGVQGMMPDSGFMMMPGNGQGMMPGGGQGAVPGGGQGMMPGGVPGMIPSGGQGMMQGGGQMMPVSGQMTVPGSEQIDLDYKEFGAEVNGHSLSIKILRKPRKPKKVAPPLPICGHIPIGKKSSSSSSEEEIPPNLPPIQFCECDFPLPPGFSKTGYNQGAISMKKKKKKKGKDNNLKCPLEFIGDAFIPNYMGNMALNNTKTMEAMDKIKNQQPVNKQIGMLGGDSHSNQKATFKPPDEQVHTSGNPTFILNIPPKVFPVEDQPFETPFQSEQNKTKPKKLTESATQYNEKDGMPPEKQVIDGKDKRNPNGDKRESKKKNGKKPKKAKKKK